MENKDYKLFNRIITIDAGKIDETDKTKILLNNAYQFSDEETNSANWVEKCPIEDFYNDIEVQLAFLQTMKLLQEEKKSLNANDFFYSFTYACTLHIYKFNRLVLRDMESILNRTMNIIDATKKELHDIILSDDNGRKLRQSFLHTAMEYLQQDIVVPIGPYGDEYIDSYGVKRRKQLLIPLLKAIEIRSSPYFGLFDN